MRLLRPGRSELPVDRGLLGPACGLVALGAPATASSSGLRWDLGARRARHEQQANGAHQDKTSNRGKRSGVSDARPCACAARCGPQREGLLKRQATGWRHGGLGSGLRVSEQQAMVAVQKARPGTHSKISPTIPLQGAAWRARRRHAARGGRHTEHVKYSGRGPRGRRHRCTPAMDYRGARRGTASGRTIGALHGVSLQAMMLIWHGSNASVSLGDSCQHTHV